MARTNPDSERNIRGIDSSTRRKRGGQTHGFQVHFQRGNDYYTRLFSDTVCGSKELAREAARDFREVLRAAIPKVKEVRARSGPSRSNTGHMGVSITTDQTTPRSGMLVVEVTVRIAKGIAKNKKYRVQDFSQLQGAIENAVNWHESLLAERILSEGEA